MPITGHFDADFEKFKTAVDSSLVKLKSFESGAASVEKRLNSMTDQFSGRRVISEATLMAEAVERIGGASKLTEAELARVSAKAAEASEKMQAMGMKVPTGIANLASQYKGLDQQVAAAGVSMGQWVASMVSADAITATLTAAMRGLVGVAKDFGQMMLEGAGVGDVEENFQRMTEAAGLVASTLMTTLREATHNTVTDFELMKTVNGDLAAGMKLTADQFNTLGKGAFALAQATGGDVKQAFDAMNEAMLTGQTRGVKQLIGQLDLTKAERDFAESLLQSADKLTEQGKVYVARQTILKAVGAATERLGEQTDGLDEKVAQAQTAWANFTAQLGKTVANSPVILSALDGLKTGLANAFGGTQELAIKNIAKAVDDLAITFIDWAKIGVQAAGFVAKEFVAVQKVFGDVIQLGELVQRAQIGAQLAGLKINQALLPSPEGQAKLKDLQAQYDALTESITKRGASLQNMDAMQAQVDAGTTKAIGVLDTMKASMEKARAESEAFVGPLQAEAGAHETAGKGAQQQGLALEDLFDTTRSGKDIIADFNAQLERMASGTTQATGPKTGLDPNAQVESLRRVRAAEDALAQAVLSELKVEEDRKKFMDDYAKHRVELTNQIIDKEKEAAGIVNDLITKELEARARVMAARGLTVGGEIKRAKTPQEQYDTDVKAIYDDVAKAKGNEVNATYRLIEATDRYVQAMGGFIQNWGGSINSANTSTQQFGASLQQAEPSVTTMGKSAGAVSTTFPAMAQGSDALTTEYQRQQQAFASFTGVVVAGTGEISAATAAVAAAMGRATHTASDVIETEWAMRQAQRDRGEIFLTGMSASRLPLTTRQGGGPVQAGRVYLVGEQGPELLVPSNPGVVLPHGTPAALPALTVNVNGVWDARSMSELTSAISRSLMFSTGRQYPSR